jgi:hydroxylamine reductase
MGVCGKEEVTADLQDVLLHQLRGIGQYRKRLGALRRQPDLVARPPQREFPR